MFDRFKFWVAKGTMWSFMLSIWFQIQLLRGQSFGGIWCLVFLKIQRLQGTCLTAAVNLVIFSVSPKQKNASANVTVAMGKPIRCGWNFGKKGKFSAGNFDLVSLWVWDVSLWATYYWPWGLTASSKFFLFHSSFNMLLVIISIIRIISVSLFIQHFARHHHEYLYIYIYTLPRKLTCPMKIDGWKMYFLLK